jgi:hypothetical protein
VAFSNPFSSFTWVVINATLPVANESDVGEVIEVSVTPTPACADARSDDNAAYETMNRETKPTKAKKTTLHFGTTEPSIGTLLKVSLFKILLFTCYLNLAIQTREYIFYS